MEGSKHFQEGMFSSEDSSVCENSSEVDIDVI